MKLRAEFCAQFPQFRSIQVRSEGPGKGIAFETKSGRIVRAQQASDGAILFLGFLALSFLPEPPTLLLIEEPENGIYPKRLDEVIKLLKGLVYHKDGTPFPQIVFSTHSPYVLTSFEPEEVTFLSRPPGDPEGPVRARPLRDAPNIRERLAGGEFYLGELWYNLTEEELFGDA
jgi:predicted ATPase